MGERQVFATTRWTIVAWSIAVTLVAAGCASGDDQAERAATEPSSTITTTMTAPPTTAPPTTAPPTTTTEAPIDAVAIVDDVIAAWNSGDFDAWLAFWVMDPDEDYLFERSVMNSNEQMAVTGTCDVSGRSDGGMRVECPIFVKDDFHGPGGLTSDGTRTFFLRDDGLIVETSTSTYNLDGVCCPLWAGYNEAFHVWLAAAYPDVYEEIGPLVGVPLWWLPGVAGGDAAHMTTALEYVAEFIADSDVYPLET